VVTKLDVLDDLDDISICTAYDYKGTPLDDFPADLGVLADCKPICETLPGWKENISTIRTYDELPQNTKNYLKRIEELTETKIDIVSGGPGREETIILNNIFD
jgi:adenylosuccinate synthase